MTPREYARCAFKVDIYKAYDSIEWDFVRRTLCSFGFPSYLINLIMECVTSPTFSVLINGVPQGFFRGKRGLMQGDPISPYLFVLCMEALSRSLRETSKVSSFKFHPKCKQLGVVHLAFADDLLIFCKGHIPSLKLIKNCLEEFSKASGLRANLDKSQCFIAGASETLQSQILLTAWDLNWMIS